MRIKRHSPKRIPKFFAKSLFVHYAVISECSQSSDVTTVGPRSSLMRMWRTQEIRREKTWIINVPLSTVEMTSLTDQCFGGINALRRFEYLHSESYNHPDFVHSMVPTTSDDLADQNTRVGCNIFSW